MVKAPYYILCVLSLAFCSCQASATRPSPVSRVEGEHKAAAGLGSAEPPSRAQRVAAAKTMVDSHLTVLASFNHEIEKAKSSPQSLAVKGKYDATLLELSMAEETLAKTLSADETNEVRM